MCVYVCDDIKASSSQGFAMCPESFDMSRCIIKTLPHAQFPVPDTTAILTLVIISSLLYSVPFPYFTYVLQRCADPTMWEIYFSFSIPAFTGVFLRLSVSPVGKLDHLGMWTLFCRVFFFFLVLSSLFSSLARRWHPKLLSLNQTDWSGVWRGQWPPSDVQPGICEGTDLTFFWGAGIWPQHSCFTPSPSHLLPSLKSFCVWSFSSSWSMILSSLDSRLVHTHSNTQNKPSCSRSYYQTLGVATFLF